MDLLHSLEGPFCRAVYTTMKINTTLVIDTCIIFCTLFNNFELSFYFQLAIEEHTEIDVVLHVIVQMELNVIT